VVGPAPEPVDVDVVTVETGRPRGVKESLLVAVVVTLKRGFDTPPREEAGADEDVGAVTVVDDCDQVSVLTPGWAATVSTPGVRVEVVDPPAPAAVTPGTVELEPGSPGMTELDPVGIPAPAPAVESAADAPDAPPSLEGPPAEALTLEAASVLVGEVCKVIVPEAAPPGPAADATLVT
jgi:hypothetical protein